MTEPFILGIAPRNDAASQPFNQISRRVGGNSGNLAFAYAVHAHLGGHVSSVRWSDSIELINQAGSPAVMPVANLLGTERDLSEAARRFKQVTVPMVAIGLGAQSNLQRSMPTIPKDTVNWVRCVADHAPSDVPNIGVRGSFTMDVLDKIGLAAHATVVGCPSLFINPTPVLGRQIAKRLRPPERVAVIAGNQHWPHLQRIEESLAQLVTQTNGSYIGQAPHEMMALTKGLARSLDSSSLQQCRDYIRPHAEIQDFVDWSVRYGNMFFDVRDWIEHYKHFDFVIGTRVHGTILGIQAGVPSLCIVHDSRTLELCETLTIPHVLPDDVPAVINRDDLISLFNFDADEFDRKRRALCRRYVEFLLSNGLVPARWLEDIGNYWEETTTCSPATP